MGRRPCVPTPRSALPGDHSWVPSPMGPYLDHPLNFPKSQKPRALPCLPLPLPLPYPYPTLTLPLSLPKLRPVLPLPLPLPCPCLCPFPCPFLSPWACPRFRSCPCPRPSLAWPACLPCHAVPCLDLPWSKCTCFNASWREEPDGAKEVCFLC